MKKRILVFVFVTMCVINYLPAQQIKDQELGVCTRFDINWDTSYFKSIKELGVGWIRDGIEWSAIEKQKGVYNLPQKDINWLKAAKNNGIKVLFLLNGSNHLYADIYDKQAYINCAKYLIRSYGSYIDAIEVQNEPQNSQFSKFYDGSNASVFGVRNQKIQIWVKKDLDLLNACAQELKALKPTIKVIGLGGGASAIVAQIQLGLNNYVDGITDHPYFKQASITNFGNNANFESVTDYTFCDKAGTYFSYVKDYQNLLSRYNQGENKEIWFTEFGFITNRNDAASNEQNQAANLLERVVEDRWLKVTRSFIYKLKDDDASKDWGLLNINGSPKLGFYVIKDAVKTLYNKTPVNNEQVSIGDTKKFVNNYDNVVSYRIYGFSDKKETVFYVWNIQANKIPVIYVRQSPNMNVQVYDCLKQKNIVTNISSSNGYWKLSGLNLSNDDPIKIIIK